MVRAPRPTAAGLTRRHLLAGAAGASLVPWLAGCAVLRGAAEPIALDWESPHGRDHPLAGRLFAPDDERLVDEAEAIERLDDAHYILLGETHDNPDHHRLQARLIRALNAGGRRPVVAFEMIESTQRYKLAAYLAANPHDAEGIGAAIGWEAAGWPPYAMYRPIFAAALELGLPIVSGNLPAETIRALGRDEPGVRSLASRLRLDRPFPPELEAALEAEIAEAHCGYVEGEALAVMARGQRARDAAMARRLFDFATKFGIVLIAGAGHCRTDRGAPYYLRRINSTVEVASLAFIEVAEDKPKPADYAAAFGAPRLPFDLVCFTPRIDTRDSCERFKNQLEKMKAKGAASGS